MYPDVSEENLKLVQPMNIYHATHRSSGLFTSWVFFQKKRPFDHEPTFRNPGPRIHVGPSWRFHPLISLPSKIAPLSSLLASERPSHAGLRRRSAWAKSASER